MKWMRRLIWWQHPEVEADQRDRDAKVRRLQGEAKRTINRADTLAAQVRRMQDELRT